MKQNTSRNVTSAVAVAVAVAVPIGIVVLLLGISPVSAEPTRFQSQAPRATAPAVPRIFSDPLPVVASAEQPAFESSQPAQPQPELPPGAISLEIKVTAVVPPMRHVIVDATGTVTQITSNTLEDIEPKVYQSDVKPGNQRLLTDEIYQLYRSAVPIGTAARGILYEQGIPLATTSGGLIGAEVINSRRN